MALATTTELANHLGRTFDPAEEVSAAQHLELASGIVEDFCDRTFTRTAEDVTVDADPVGRTVVLDSPPIAVTSITLDGEDVDGYTVYADAGIVVLPYRSTWGRVSVTYSHGIDGAPSSVKAVVLAVAGRMMTNPDSATQKSTGDASVSYSTSSVSLSEQERETLTSYLLMGVA